MATHDYVIANGSGSAVRSDLNNALAAIVSNNSSSSEPATTYAYQWWADTNNNLLKLRNSANNGWLTVRSLTGGSLTIDDGTAAAPALAFTDDTNTGIYSPQNDQVAISTGGTERFRARNTEIVINEQSNDYNFRVETNNSTNTLFVDGGEDRVGIRTSSPDAALHVNSGTINKVATFQSSDTGANIELVDSNATSRIDQNGANLLINADVNDADDASSIRFLVDNTTRATIDNSGRLLVGLTAGSGNNLLHVRRAVNSGDVGIVVQNSGTSNQSASLYLNKGSGTEVDYRLKNNASDRFTIGRGTNEGAFTDHIMVNEHGALKQSTTGTFQSASSAASEYTQDSASTPCLKMHATSTSYADHALRIAVERSASSNYTFARFESGGFDPGGDNEFKFEGDGNAYADNNWNSGGADYAEYFEWSDGNASEEDRRGISVVLDGDKIREAVAGEDPIGVISGNPSVVGDAGWNKWSGKHLRDDYGSYVLDDNGDRQLNPEYDPDLTYVSREDRPEWDCVGLMGKLRIRKGQVTGSRWIKMRDVSDTIEEWLVR